VAAGPEMLAHFHAAHRKRYGHADKSGRVEVVNVRVRMISSAETSTCRADRLPNGLQAYGAQHKRVMFGKNNNNDWLDTPVLRRDLLSRVTALRDRQSCTNTAPRRLCLRDARRGGCEFKYRD